MLLFFIFLIPVLITGIIILRKISSVERFELLFPAGSILGLVIFTFFLNLTAFLFKGSSGIVISYLLVTGLGLGFFKLVKSEKVNFPGGKQLIFWMLSILFWGGFIYWKTANALTGSDSNLYYAIAHSFVKGNFPFLTPWQPDIPLSYHTGASELLGAFYYFTGLDFQFLHLFFSGLFIFLTAQIIIWLLKRSATLTSFLLSNLATAVTFISFGFIYITWPVSVQLPVFGNINQLVFWLRDLPSVGQAIEVYGAPINLDALIYFIFHAFGLAIFFSLIVLVLNLRKENKLMGWVIIIVGLSGLALVNESLFIAAFPALLFGITKNIKKMILLAVAIIIIVSFQGGVISSSINSLPFLEKPALILPKKEEIKEDFTGYHRGQQLSKLLPSDANTLPLRWFHIGTDILLLLSLFAVLLFNNSVLLKILFISGLSSLVAYNVIVPKFLVANGNRFLSASFLFFSLLLCLSLILLFEKIQKNNFKKILLFIIIGWVFIPSILPPLVLLSKNRFGENKLVPKITQSSKGILWLKKNIKFNERIVVLDKNAPHPSGQIRALAEAGVFAPVFSGDFRAFTIEASPEYMDIAYYLSPKALKKLKINLLLIDNNFLKTLPDTRKQQLQNNKFFEKVFEDTGDGEAIYKIKETYLAKGQEIDGTFDSLLKVIPDNGKIYIDNEESFEPSFLRRPLIFSIKDRDIYFLPQSGVYLNVEANINSHSPHKDGNYDYLVLGKNTNPENLCKCQAELVWTGIRGQVFLWKANH